MTPQTASMLRLLSLDDPEPTEIVNALGKSAFVLTVEHAGRAIPKVLGDLGIEPAEMERHIAYDIGAEALGRLLSARLDAPLLVQRYSRLVIDSNRPLDAPDAIPPVSDGTVIPVNQGLDHASRRARYDEIHQPFHRAVTRMLDARARAKIPTALVSLHSFTPSLAGKARPWQLGVLFNRDGWLAHAFMDAFTARFPDIVRAFNEPYLADDLSDYTVPVHGEGRRIPHVLLEVRNDEIDTEAGQARWARMLSDAFTACPPIPEVGALRLATPKDRSFAP